MQNAYPSLHKLQAFLSSKNAEDQRVAEVPTKATIGQTFYNSKVIQPQNFSSQSDYLKAQQQTAVYMAQMRMKEGQVFNQDPKNLMLANQSQAFSAEQFRGYSEPSATASPMVQTPGSISAHNTQAQLVALLAQYKHQNEQQIQNGGKSHQGQSVAMQNAFTNTPQFRGHYECEAPSPSQMSASTAQTNYPDNRTAMGRIEGYQRAPGIPLFNPGSQGLVHITEGQFPPPNTQDLFNMLVKAKSTYTHLQEVCDQIAIKTPQPQEAILPERGFFFGGMPRILPQPLPFERPVPIEASVMTKQPQQNQDDLKSKTVILQQLFNSLSSKLQTENPAKMNVNSATQSNLVQSLFVQDAETVQQSNYEKAEENQTRSINDQQQQLDKGEQDLSQATQQMIIQCATTAPPLQANTKTSKRVLNMNAVKFKLTKLRTTSIRYEVIYKNLVRDLRKFYSKDFNDVTEYIKKKKSMPEQYNYFLQCYVKAKFSQYLPTIGESPSGKQAADELVFNLGSLIYPKEMIKSLGEGKNEEKQNVVAIYNQLYKFSLERLQQFLSNKALMLLLLMYLKSNSFSRVHRSSNMLRHREAYYEAFQVMIMHSTDLEVFRQAFNLEELLAVPTVPIEDLRKEQDDDVTHSESEEVEQLAN